MDTTCGSYALKGAKACKDAAIAEMLEKAGMIIIAKKSICMLHRSQVDFAIAYQTV